MDKAISSFGAAMMVTAVVLSSGCKQEPNPLDLTTEQWQAEIQKRYDFANPDGQRAVCLVVDRVTSFPFTTEFGPNDSLVTRSTLPLVQAGLVSESVSLNKGKGKEQILYTYTLTEQGRKYQVDWPRARTTGFCYGKIVVNKVLHVSRTPSNTSIKYTYSIEGVPKWAKDFSLPASSGEETSLFGKNENNQLYCAEGIENHMLNLSTFVTRGQQ